MNKPSHSPGDSLEKKVKKNSKEICKIKRKLFCPRKIKQHFSITEECAACEE